MKVGLTWGPTIRWLLPVFGALLILVPSALRADQQTEEVALTFTVFSLDRRPISGVFFMDPEGKMTELAFHPRRRSVAYDYLGSPRMAFFRQSGTDQDGRPFYEEVADVEVSPGVSEVLVFFLDPNSRSEETVPRFRTLWMDDSKRAFPFGHLRVVNACGANLVGKMGEMDLNMGFEVSPSRSIRELSQGQSNYVNIAFAVRIRSDYEIVYANQVAFSQDTRSILILRPPRRPNSIQINTYLLEQSETTVVTDS